MLEVRTTNDPVLISHVSRHPHLNRVGECDSLIEWTQNGWNRKITKCGGSSLCGLIELLDNNPLVCADEASILDPAATLALVALGPMIRAGILVEPPSLLYSFEPELDCLQSHLPEFGWSEGLTVAIEPQEMGTVLACAAMGLVSTPANLDDLDLLYEEAYGRSFFVRMHESGPWSTELVKNTPYAIIQLRVTVGEPHTLLTAQVLADRNGKLGNLQALHMMNVMEGWEESLGIL